MNKMYSTSNMLNKNRNTVVGFWKKKKRHVTVETDQFGVEQLVLRELDKV